MIVTIKSKLLNKQVVSNNELATSYHLTWFGKQMLDLDVFSILKYDKNLLQLDNFRFLKNWINNKV